jgi:hypothetical protein
MRHPLGPLHSGPPNSGQQAAHSPQPMCLRALPLYVIWHIAVSSMTPRPLSADTPNAQRGSDGLCSQVPKFIPLRRRCHLGPGVISKAPDKATAITGSANRCHSTARQSIRLLGSFNITPS